MLSFFSVVLLFSTTTAQPYNATDRFFLACGSSTTTTTDRRWDGDQNSRFVPSNIITNSFSSKPDYVDPLVHQTPYSTARIINISSFAYRFPVSQGPKFLRLYFYPTTYSNLNPNQSYFTVSSNGYSLLTNFSASLTAYYLKRKSFIKEYIIYVKDTQILNVTFTPAPNSYAFINGIEIVSMPEDLYFKPGTWLYNRMDRSLASPNPELGSTIAPARNGKRNKKKPPYAVIIGGVVGVSVLVVIVFHIHKGVIHLCAAYSTSKSSHSTVSSSLVS